MSIIKQSPLGLLTGYSGGVIFSTEGTLSHLPLANVKLTKKTKKTQTPARIGYFQRGLTEEGKLTLNVGDISHRIGLHSEYKKKEEN